MKTSSLDLEKVISTIQSVARVHSRTEEIPLHAPEFGGNEWKYVKECLDTGWVSSAGKYVGRFEEELVRFTGAKYAVAVVNGTAALQICLKLAGVGAGDEVLIPTLTFVATANAVVHAGAIPHLVESSPDTLGVDPVALAEYLASAGELRAEGLFNRHTGKRIRALVPMHTFGHCVDLDALLDVCGKFRLTLVEDAAESLGSTYKDRHAGTFGKISALSFNGNKIVTTGGGGAILTDDPALAAHAKHLTTTAKLPHPWAFVHDEVGYNYRLPNLNAALGCAQLERLPDFLARKRKLALSYQEAFAGMKGCRIVTEPSFDKSNYWLNTLLLDEDHAGHRDTILEFSRKVGLMTRPCWTLMHRLPMYQDCPRMSLNVAESLERRIVNVPSSANLAH